MFLRISHSVTAGCKQASLKCSPTEASYSKSSLPSIHFGVIVSSSTKITPHALNLYSLSFRKITWNLCRLMINIYEQGNGHSTHLTPFQRTNWNRNRNPQSSKTDIWSRQIGSVYAGETNYLFWTRRTQIAIQPQLKCRSISSSGEHQ